MITFKDVLIDHIVSDGNEYDEFYLIKDIKVYGDWLIDDSALVYICEDLD